MQSEPGIQTAGYLVGISLKVLCCSSFGNEGFLANLILANCCCIKVLWHSGQTPSTAVMANCLQTSIAE